MGFAVAALIVTIISIAISTYMQVKQSEDTAEQNEAIEKQKKQEAQQAIESAAFEERQQRRRNAILLGRQESIFAAAGLDTASGTALLMQLDSTREAEMEALNIRRTGKITEAGRLFEARLAKFRKDSAKGAIPFQILGGVAKAGSAAAGYAGGGSSGSVLSDWV